MSSTALGVTALAGLGIIMGAWTMTMARHFWSVGDAVSGAMYLFCGAIFPLDTLPVWLRWIGYLLPVTYWLEAARRALLGPNAAGFETFSRLSNPALLADPGRVHGRAAGRIGLLLPLGAAHG